MSVEYIDPTGYHEMAKLEANRAHLLVLSNNSSHILVVKEHDEAMTDGTRSAIVLASYQYSMRDGDDLPFWRTCYWRALLFVADHLFTDFNDED